MPRPSQANQKRRELLPLVARSFAELGYRRSTTAQLARRCKVQETILYRLWPDKKAMFIAAIDHVYDLSARTWEGVATGGTGGSKAQTLLDYESKHLGEFGHARIVFAGLSETDDPQIRRALARMYLRYQKFVCAQVRSHRARPAGGAARKRRTAGATAPDPVLAAWALIGLGTVASIARELDLLGDRERRRLMVQVGSAMLGSRKE